MYLTSYDQDDMIEKIGQTKPHSYMLKPFTEKELKLNISIILYRSEIEQKLRYKDRWITSIINNISDAILVVDLQGKLLFMNKITKDICYLETEKKDILLHNIIDFFDDELNPFDREFVNHSIKNKAAIMYDHMIIKVLSNDQYQTDCFVSPLILEEDRVEGAVITLKNLKKVEPQLVQ